MKKKIETSKLFLFIITIITALIVGLSCWFVIKYNSENTLSFLIPSIFAELGAATGVYYWKSKSENKIKMTLNAVQELSQIDNLTEEQVRIIEALVNTLS